MAPVIIGIRIVSVLVAGGLLVVAVMRALLGRDSLAGLLEHKVGASRGDLSPARIQLLATTFAVSLLYLQRVIATHPTGTLPDIPTAVLPFVAASHITYMAGKFWSVVARSRRPSNR